jgi:hypothetical protein
MTHDDAQMQPEVEDDTMMDDGPGDDDLDAMLASYEQDAATLQRPKSPSYSDDEYDDIFEDLMSREQAHPSQGSQPDASDAMQLSQDMMY